MKCFVAGAKGMLAADLIGLLQVKGEVVKGDLPDFDITDVNVVTKKLRDINPEIVVNCAAYTAVDKAESEKERAFLVNGRGAENLALACKETNSRLIHVSTDFIFDGEKGVPYDENDSPNPLSVYGSSKLEGERKIQEVMDDAIIVRTSWLYGRHGNNFVETIKRLASEREELGIVYDQLGTPTYTRDLACGIVALLDNAESGLYHFANEGVCSWYDFACEIVEMAEACGENLKLKKLKPILTKEYPTPAVRPKYSVMDKAKYKAATNRDIPHWRDGLKRYFQSKGEGLTVKGCPLCPTPFALNP